MSSIETFGQLVKARRRELGLTQDELAHRVGCAPVTLRKIEYDDLRPSVQIAERLAMALNIPLEERAAFVRLARTERVPEPLTPTPAPKLEEIGAEDLTGRSVRGYALAERIGTGGMGAVYRATQPVVEREVAIKIILPEYANQPDFIRRFEAEAQIVARLEHPHIVPLYDYWREPSVAFLVMRLLRGGSLRELLEKGALPLDRVTHLLEQIGSALGAAHRAGVVHRDLKPANVMLDEDTNAYLADFGIAKNLSNPNLDDQTQADAIIGSPAYISPEQIRSEFVRPQSDIYALGVMLYELLTGAIPFSGPTPIDIMHQHLNAPLPPLAANRTGLPKAWDGIIAKATAKDPLERYANVESLLNDVRAVSGGAAAVVGSPRLTPTDRRVLTAEDNPYKGLRAFGEGDAADFFGREALTTQLLVRLSEGGDLARFLAVIGPSGSGKSSVVEAGVVPALRRGALPGSENWFIVPLLPGPHPLEELEAALLRVAVNPPDSLLTQLREDKRGLLRAVRRCLPDDPNVELVLVIDQFEEVFTLVSDEAVRAHLLDSLTTAVLDERSRVRVIVTLRADFTDRPLSYVDFGELVRQRSEFVLPLTPDELEQAIVGPAERVGLRFEEGLVSSIMRDVGDEPGALPLLQYALTELFEQREDQLLTKAAYQSIGGVLGALGRRAEEVYQGLSETDQASARQLFLRLVTLGEGVEDTRRRVLRSELESIGIPTGTLRNQQSAISNVLDAFGKHRLLTFDRDPLTHGPTVEVAHEALLREWERLREWLNESRADVRWQRTLAEEAAQWDNAQRDASYLLIGAHLEQFEGWAATTTVALTQDERTYLDASVAERDRQRAAEADRQRRELLAARQLAETERARAEEQTQAANRLRMRNRALAVAGALVTAAAIIAIIFGGQANQNATRADQNAQQAQTNLNIAQANAATAEAASVLAANSAHAAEAARNNAVNAQATAVVEAQIRATQQAVAEANFTRAEAQRLAAEANRLLLGGGNPELIALLSLRSMNTQYTSQGDSALTAASRLAYPEQIIVGPKHAYCLTLSSDGKYLVIGRDDHSVRLYDVKTGKEIRQFVGHTAAVQNVAYSSDGKYIATASADKTTRVWDATTGQEVHRFTLQTDKLTGVAFSPDGKYVLGDTPARIWDVTTGQEVRQFHSQLGAVASVAFSHDGKTIVTGNADGSVEQWDARTGTEVNRFTGHTSPVYLVRFSPDDKFVLTASGDTTARLWDAATGKELQRFTGHTNPVYGVAFSPDGKQVFTASGDGTARLWDITTGQELQQFPSLAPVYDLTSSPDGQSIWTVSDDGMARLWSVKPKTELPVFQDGGNVAALAFSSDGKFILTGSLTGGSEGVARLWNANTGQMLREFRGHTGWINPSGVAFSPDGKKVVTGSVDKTVRIWDSRTGQELYQLMGYTDRVNSVAFSPDGKLILTAGFNGAQLWDTETGQEVSHFGGGSQLMKAVFSPDGKYVATARQSDDGTELWDAKTGKMQQRFTGTISMIGSVDFSPDGKYLLSTDSDGVAWIWDVQTGKLVRQFVGHSNLMYSANYSPDGRYIATVSNDDTAHLWDAQTGQELRRFTGHTAALENVVFSPDGKYILTGSDDGTARLWDLDYHTTMAYLCSHLRDLTDDERAQYGITDNTPTCPPNQNTSSTP